MEKIDISEFEDTKEKAGLKDKKALLFAGGIVLAFLIAAISFFLWAASFKQIENIRPVTNEEKTKLTLRLDELYAKERTSLLRELSYPVNPVHLDIAAESAILVDASNGCVIYEKNADLAIPPASLTKLFAMYQVLELVKEGKINLEDAIQPPESSWAVNMPPDSSLMHLAQGQHLTWRTLLQGMAIVSGNDAAQAAAILTAGSTHEFVAKMNKSCEDLGLRYTHFVEPTGYSEVNTTTARDLASFIRKYLEDFPTALKDFHSLEEFSYPLEENLPDWEKAAGNSKAITKKNTNPLMGLLEGCDGIKTGFIYESGYNLALTAIRGKTRFISVTLRGPGNSTAEGNKWRTHDGKELMEFAFSAFADFTPPALPASERIIPVAGAKEKFVELIPAWNKNISVPNISGNGAAESANKVTAVVTRPPYLYGAVNYGSAYGQIQYKLGDTVLETVPLVADRSIRRASIWGRFWGTLVCFTLRK